MHKNTEHISRLFSSIFRRTNGVICKALLLPALIAVLGLSSCTVPKHMVYLEDITETTPMNISTGKELVVEPNDQLSIIVSSRDPELSALFNLPIVTHVAGASTLGGYTQQVATYNVSANGDIVFPYLGEVEVAGLSRRQVAEKIKNELIQKKLLNDPVVTVDFSNIFFSVSGEVSKPGRFKLDREEMTIFDALSCAGDLTVYGKRENVKVMRRENGQQKVYVVDLTNGSELAKSPVFYIKQNDVIYVSPNDTRMRHSTVNGNNVISASFWLSLASVLSTICVLIFK